MTVPISESQTSYTRTPRRLAANMQTRGRLLRIRSQCLDPLRKGPLPVNTIGPMVDLTPGSISIAVDRLVSKGLVSRVESAEDRRVRIVALTPAARISLFPPFVSIPRR